MKSNKIVSVFSKNDLDIEMGKRIFLFISREIGSILEEKNYFFYFNKEFTSWLIEWRIENHFISFEKGRVEKSSSKNQRIISLVKVSSNEYKRDLDFIIRFPFEGRQKIENKFKGNSLVIVYDDLLSGEGLVVSSLELFVDFLISSSTYENGELIFNINSEFITWVKSGCFIDFLPLSKISFNLDRKYMKEFKYFDKTLYLLKGDDIEE